MRRHRDKDRLTTATCPSADRIVQLVKLHRAQAKPYEPDGEEGSAPAVPPELARSPGSSLAASS